LLGGIAAVVLSILTNRIQQEIMLTRAQMIEQ
jgi:hypothetical protein